MRTKNVKRPKEHKAILWAIRYNFVVKNFGKWRERDDITLYQYDIMMIRLNKLLEKKLGL